MRSMKNVCWLALLLVLVLAFGVRAATVQPLMVAERTRWDATHMVTITHADLTESTTNTAQTLGSLLSVAAKEGVELMAMQLVTPFTYSTTNGFNSVTVTVGDGSDADLYLTSTELCSHGTEVYLKFGRLPIDTATTVNAVTGVTDNTSAFMTGVTATMATNTITYLNTSTNAATNTIVYVSAVTPATANAVTSTTAATSALMASEATTDTRKLYTSADYVDFVFTPSPAAYSLSQLDAGEVRFYFRIVDAAEE